MRPRKLSSLTFSVACALCVGIVTLIPSISAPSSAQAAEDGRHIMEQVSLTRKLSGSEAHVKMTIINDKGEKRERELSMATKLYDGGKTEKRIYRFLSPADVKGTGVLVFDHEKENDDVWIFLPALRKTRRIVSSERSKSFMGSEFSYGDLNTPSLDDYTYNVLKEEKVKGELCWVVEVTPKNSSVADSEGYSKKVYWVSKADFTLRKGVFYDPKGKELKELTASNVKLLDAKNKRYRAMRMEMVNLKNKRRSIFESTKVELSPNTKDDYFTTRYLERP